MTTKPTNRRARRMGVIVAALMALAAPAFAAVVIQSYSEAAVQAAPGCFEKVAGNDTGLTTGANPSDPFVGFVNDGSNTFVDAGVPLMEELLTVRGFDGDRVTYTDIIRYENNCSVALDITLSGATASGDWTGRAASLYISEVAAPGNDLSVGADWDQAPIAVAAGGTVTNATTGTVTVPAGGELRGAIVVSSAWNITPATTGTLNWIAEAAS